MYTPKQFQQEDRQILIESIRTIGFGACVIFHENHFYSSHIPFIIKEDNNTIVLEGHVSKANKLWTVAEPQNQALVIFQGPNAYIHPGWYPTKAKTGKVVPTWNYQAIHCHGYAESQDSEKWILEHITELTHHNEVNQENPWNITDAPKDYILTLLKGIIGIKIKIDRLEGSLKMNQHHTRENRLGVIEGLSKSNKPNECEVAKIMYNRTKSETI